MSLLFSSLKLDVRLQARSKLYAIGVVVAILLGLTGRLLFDPAYAGRVLSAFYVLGLGGTTYMFGASLMLLEKSEGTLQALRTTPLTSSTYIASKAITLTSFAILESVIVYAVSFFGVGMSPAPVLFGLVCLGLFYTFVGMGQVASHSSVTAFLFPNAVITGLILQLPALYLLDVGPPWLWHLIPTMGPLLLMLGAFEPIEPWQWAYAVGVSLLSVGVAGAWAKRRFSTYIKLQEA